MTRVDKDGVWIRWFGWDFAYWFPWAFTPFSARKRGLPHWWGRIRITRLSETGTRDA